MNLDIWGVGYFTFIFCVCLKLFHMNLWKKELARNTAPFFYFNYSFKYLNNMEKSILIKPLKPPSRKFSLTPSPPHSRASGQPLPSLCCSGHWDQSCSYAKQSSQSLLCVQVDGQDSLPLVIEKPDNIGWQHHSKNSVHVRILTRLSD